MATMRGQAHSPFRDRQHPAGGQATLSRQGGFVLTILAALLLGTLPLARAEGPPTGLSDPLARAHVERAEAAYAAGDYRRASAELEAAYAQEPKRDLLFAWAQAERLGGNCPRAAELYRKFLAQNPPPAEAVKAWRQLERCQALGAAQSQAAAPPASRTSRAALTSSEPTPGPRPWYRDWLGNGLALGAIAGLATGAGFLGAAASAENEAERATLYGQYQDRVNQADQRRLVGGVLLATGGALAVTALVRYLLHARRERSRLAEVQVIPGAASLLARF